MTESTTISKIISKEINDLIFDNQSVNNQNIGNRYLSEKLSIPPGSFLIRVIGNSMINAGISSGDYLIVNKIINNPIDKIIIAKINNQLTVKKLTKESNTLFLMPENNDYEAIKINDEDNFQILGIAIKVIKRFD